MSQITALKNLSISVQPAPLPAASTGFADVIAQVRASSAPEGIRGDAFSQIEKMERQLEGGAQFTPQQMLMYQMKVNRYALSVELVSKVVDSASSTVKKLQQG